jgi:hypothetical protein
MAFCWAAALALVRAGAVAPPPAIDGDLLVRKVGAPEGGAGLEPQLRPARALGAGGPSPPPPRRGPRSCFSFQPPNPLPNRTHPPAAPPCPSASQVVPIGGLFALTLWLGNTAYVYISVSLIQMIKVGGGRGRIPEYHGFWPG